MMVAEAATGGSFNFSSFQQSFQEAWDFVFPNALMLLLCFGTARFVGKVSFPWLRVPLDKAKQKIRDVSTFLEELHLFGSKLLPAIILFAVVIATLDIFRVVRQAASNLLPPDVITVPSRLYARLASDDLLLRLLVRDTAISSGNDIYRQIDQWGDRLRHSSNLPGSENFMHWEKQAGEWSMREGDFKLLAAVALVACGAGLIRKRWFSPLRALLVLTLLAAGFAYSVAKELYAREQECFAVLNSLDQELRTGGGLDWKPLLRKRAADLSEQEWWLTSPRPEPGAWWELRWADRYFYTRAMSFFRYVEDSSHHSRPPLLTKEELERWQNELNAGQKPEAVSPTPNGSPPPGEPKRAGPPEE